jgi:hypothetical protein
MLEVKGSETGNKPINEMIEKEILRQQLELLAEQSKGALPDELCNLSMSMARIYELLIK